MAEQMSLLEEDDLSDITHSRYLLSTDFGERQKQYEKHIIIGSCARRLERRREGRWTYTFRVYVKGTENEDIYDYVQKVVFRFSDECANRICIVDRAPYQAISYCNAEFPVTLTLFFRDVNQTCVIFHHGLKLCPHGLGDEPPDALQETHQTITFVNPSTRMLKFLRRNQPIESTAKESSNSELTAVVAVVAPASAPSLARAESIAEQFATTLNVSLEGSPDGVRRDLRRVRKVLSPHPHRKFIVKKPQAEKL
ncbi:protein AF-9 homolog [Scaptodrosophila lebanonensis]|uniref:Protein AF-9 homolog n=1 Tax=Drosophila lebanonensis TaxID=7225 RepID=A0A6J2U150_DROLE|nr:protein AF-9 homolog [Scaptodrosophila lebanonensis]